MAVQCPKLMLPVTDVSLPIRVCPITLRIHSHTQRQHSYSIPGRKLRLQVSALASGDSSKKAAAPNSNYVVPLDKSSCITRPLAEILRDLNKRIPDNIIKNQENQSTFIPWYHANRMLSFYAPGWCGEVRDVIFSENGSVTVVYRVTLRDLDGECYSENSPRGMIAWWAVGRSAGQRLLLNWRFPDLARRLLPQGVLLCQLFVKAQPRFVGTSLVDGNLLDLCNLHIVAQLMYRWLDYTFMKYLLSDCLIYFFLV